VQLVQTFFASSPMPTGSVVAAFAAPGSFADLLACSGGLATAGSCCLLPPLQLDAGPPPLSAGDLTVNDNGVRFGSMTFGAQGYDDIGSPTNPSTKRGWAPGDTLGIVASGGMIPAFSASMVAPAEPAGVIPSPTAPTISLGADWKVQWTPSTAAPSVFVLELYAAESASSDLIKCVVDDAAGSLTVPASLLAHFTPVSPTSLIVARAVRSTVGSGSAAVELVAYATLQGNAMLVP
jgi:hypothetical protein